jgi:hypothetical protein
MAFTSTFWRNHIFMLVVVVCGAFIALTTIAMFFYPGGMSNNPTSQGYSFFQNFFSELGLTQGWGGQPNTISAVLFFIALAGAGAGLTLFFILFPQFFWQTRSGKWLGIVGSLFGIVAGICFVGVAFTPANLFLDAHKNFVLWAVELFPVAVLCYAIAIFRDLNYPKRFGWVFVAFGVLLIVYVWLLNFGPSTQTLEGLMIQATGQKIIVYASIISIMIQAWGARIIAQRTTSK